MKPGLQENHKLADFVFSGVNLLCKEERKKLDSKSNKCILLGYGSTTKGYRLYDPLKRKVLHSRDVIFNEQKYGFNESSKPQESERQGFLERLDEPPPTVESPTVESPTVESPTVESPTVESPTVESPAPPPRRSERDRRQPSYYGFQRTLSDVREPKSISDALKSQEWAEAEIDSLRDHNVWELPYSGKLLREKTFANFADFRPSAN